MKPNREDVLISRVVDREEEPTDWRELDRIAAGDGELWTQLLYALRQDAAVRAAVAPALAAADRSAPPASVRRAGRAPERSRRAWIGWIGWAAALVMAAWIASGVGARPATQDPMTQNTVATEPAASTSSAEDARVLRELSRVVVRARPADDGHGVEVVYVRRVLERAVVDQLYQIGEDELGMPVRTRVDPARFERPSSY